MKRASWWLETLALILIVVGSIVFGTGAIGSLINWHATVMVIRIATIALSLGIVVLFVSVGLDRWATARNRPSVDDEWAAILRAVDEKGTQDDG